MSTLQIEDKVGIPIENALTFAKLMVSWFEDVATARVPANHPFLALNEDERRMIDFGFRDLVERLTAIDAEVSGLGGICPR